MWLKRRFWDLICTALAVAAATNHVLLQLCPCSEKVLFIRHTAEQFEHNWTLLLWNELRCFGSHSDRLLIFAILDILRWWRNEQHGVLIAILLIFIVLDMHIDIASTRSTTLTQLAFHIAAAEEKGRTLNSPMWTMVIQPVLAGLRSQWQLMRRSAAAGESLK